MFKTPINNHLYIKILEEKETQALFELIHTSRDYLREWLPFVEHTKSPSDTQNFIKSGLIQFANNNGFQCGIWLDYNLVGVIGLHHIDWVNRSTSLGYYLAEQYQSKGIMSQTVEFFISYLFNDLNLNRIEIRVATGNVKSMRIPERFGFTFEGVAREAEYLNGEFKDLNRYSLLKSEYKNGDS